MPVTVIPDLPDNVVGFVASGEVRGDDYKTTIDPAVEAALSLHDRVRLLYVLGDDFAGFKEGAAWEDGKLGMKHLTKWEKIAFVTDHEHMRHAVNLVGYLIPGKVKVYATAQRADATSWVSS